MEKNLLEGRLRERVNRKFRDENTEPFFIDQFILKDGKATVWCDGQPVDFISYEECNSWINQLEEISGAKRERQIPVKENSLAPTTKPSLPAERSTRETSALTYQPKIGSSVLSDTKDIVLENIKRLQGEKGAEFIPQAQQINKEVHTIIDLAKTEIELIKVMKS